MPPQRLRAESNDTVSARLERQLGAARWRWHQLKHRSLRGQPAIRLGRGAHIILVGDGAIEVGTGVNARPDLTLSSRGLVSIGNRVFLGRGTNIACYQRVSIGDDARLAERVSIHDSDHVMEPLSDREGRRHDALVEPVCVGERVWLGANVVVLRGVTIGDDAVVAANSVVTSDVPAGVLAAGVPARVIRELVR